MSTTNSKENTPERNTGADCPICKNYRYSINDFCCKCGKRLNDTRVLVNRYAPSWHDLICKIGHGRTKENAPDWNEGVDCTFCQNYRDIGENFCGICGKKLTEPTMPMNYDLPKWGTLGYGSGHSFSLTSHQHPHNGHDFGYSCGHNFGITIHHHSHNGHVPMSTEEMRQELIGTPMDQRDEEFSQGKQADIPNAGECSSEQDIPHKDLECFSRTNTNAPVCALDPDRTSNHLDNSKMPPKEPNPL